MTNVLAQLRKAQESTITVKKAKRAKPERQALGGVAMTEEAGLTLVEAAADLLAEKGYNVKLVGENKDAEPGQCKHAGIQIKTKMESTNVEYWGSGRVYITDQNVLTRAGFDFDREGIVWDVVVADTDEVTEADAEPVFA